VNLWRERKRKGRHVFMAVMMALSIIQVFPAPAAAAGEAFTGSSAVSGVYGVPTAITDLQVSGTGNDTINVRLFVTNGSLAMSTTTGLTFTGSSTGSPLQFSGTRSDVNTALATLTYTRSTPGTDTLEASLVGAGEIYYPANGHLYEVVTSTLTWTNAQAAAAARTKYGATGYLTTITSDEENDFVAARLNNAGWMGASDATTENDWQWVTGPETGTSFWSGLANGSAVSGRYENWADGEPNNAGNEDCAQFLAGSTGEWNDLPCTVTTLPRYVVEYGTTGTLPAVQSKNVAITTGTSTRTISNCTQLHTMANTANSRYDTFELTGDIDCSGISNFAPIGSAGTAWNNFSGIFDGNGHTIRNLTINDPDNDGGLFHVLQNATVRDLTLDGGTVTTVNDWAGALAGRVVESVTLENITSNIDVATGGSYAGGIIGHLSSSTGTDSAITNVRSSGTITENNSSASYGMGGIIGEVDVSNGSELTLTRTAFTGTMTGYHNVGGLVGRLTMSEDGNTGLTIQDSYTDATITGLMFVGGLVGTAEIIANTGNNAGLGYLTIRRSYAASDITGDDFAGGLIGNVTQLNTAGETLTITDSFAASSLAGSGTIRSLFNADGAVTGGTLTINDVYVDDLRSNLASWTNLTVSSVTNVNTTGSPDADYFFRTTTQEPLDEWDFSSGNVWYQHPDTFPTHEPGNDDDEDGISRTSEDAGPNNGDANNDGILDSTQKNVVSLTSSVSGQPIGLELPSACQLTQLSSKAESQLGVSDTGYDYPQGLVKFTADCGTPGYTAAVELYFYNVSPGAFELRKHNAARNAYYAMPSATLTGLTIGGLQVTRANYGVTDGSQLDEDAAANGSITDPAGLALGAVAVPNTGLGAAGRY
jgi:hypothetical protein